MLVDNGISDEIITALLPLKGQKLNYISRAANMLDIGFGNSMKYISSSNNEHVAACFAIHVQSSWRFVKDKKIVLAFNDFYIPKDNIAFDVFEEKQFGNSQFDIRSDKINNIIKNLQIKVINIIANNLGDITIFFENGFSLEIFVDVSGMKESWRFFRMDDDLEHFVVFDE